MKILLPLLLTVAGFGWWLGAFDRWLPADSPWHGASVADEREAPVRTVYEWTDARGRRHFGDDPPPGVNARPIQLKPVNIVDDPVQAAMADQQVVASAAQGEAERGWLQRLGLGR